MNDGLSNPSQLLLRSRGQLVLDSLLLVNPPADGIFSGLAGAHALTLDWGDYLVLETQGDNARFGVQPSPDSPAAYAQVAVFLTKAKARTRMLLDFAAAACEAGGRVWLLGEKKAGIGSGARLLEETVGTASKLDAARHCMLFEARHPIAGLAPFSLEPYWQLDQWSLAGSSYPVASLPGVFSHGELDPGTRMLLECLAIDGQPETLDFGCGCGIVAALLARRGARVSAADSDALAIEATARTLELNGVEAAAVFAADGLAQIPGRFDLIVSNPPFHRGTRTATATAHELIRGAPGRLRPGGRLLLVANTFLDYPRVLDAAFGSHRVLAQDNRYRVYEASARA